MDLVELIYNLTSKFPTEEKFGIISQMRRCAVSIPSNIAEGSARKGDTELVQFLMIAMGSLAELETQYIIAVRLKMTKNKEEIETKLLEVKKILLGFRNYIVNKNK